MRVMVMDGQGGGVGRVLVEALHAALPEVEIVAVGTNATATSGMLRAGATMGATGENAVAWNARRADVIVGPIGIFFANAMAGEITPGMAESLAGSLAEKIAVPVSRCHIHIAGVRDRPMREYIDEAVEVVCGIGRRISG